MDVSEGFPKVDDKQAIATLFGEIWESLKTIGGFSAVIFRLCEEVA
jgi:hypothetical protein